MPFSNHANKTLQLVQAKNDILEIEFVDFQERLVKAESIIDVFDTIELKIVIVRKFR